MKVDNEWLEYNLKLRVRQHRAQAKYCRNAYKTEPMRSLCNTLADAHQEAAEAFERRLPIVSKKS